MNDSRLEAEKKHLSEYLEAIQRCVFFLHGSVQKISWPLTDNYLIEHKKDVQLFESLSSVNERFSKLQDTLGAAMRHATILSGEPNDTFLKVLAFYEKIEVIDSVDSWQLCRTTRNLAAHDYGIDYAKIAEHFNSLHELIPLLYKYARRFVNYCQENLDIAPVPGYFDKDFQYITQFLE